MISQLPDAMPCLNDTLYKIQLLHINIPLLFASHFQWHHVHDFVQILVTKQSGDCAWSGRICKETHQQEAGNLALEEALSSSLLLLHLHRYPFSAPQNIMCDNQYRNHLRHLLNPNIQFSRDHTFHCQKGKKTKYCNSVFSTTIFNGLTSKTSFDQLFAEDMVRDNHLHCRLNCWKHIEEHLPELLWTLLATPAANPSHQKPILHHTAMSFNTNEFLVLH